MIQAEHENTLSQSSVVLVHPDSLISEGISSILTDAGFSVLAQVEKPDNLEQLANQLKPDIILIDWSYQAEIIEKLKRKYKGVIVVLAHPEHQDITVESTQAGAMGCLSVKLDANEFIQSLQTICMGSMVISGDMTESLTSRIKDDRTERKDDLSDREIEVLRLIGNGASNREIAENLIISEHTVKAHVRSILNKLNIRNRQQIAAYAVREGVTEEDDSEE